MCIVEVTLCCNRFTVSYLRSTSFYFTVVFALHTFNVYFKVKFTHTADNCFTRFRICKYAECRVFFCEAVQSLRHLHFCLFIFWLNRKRNYRLWDEHRSHRVVNSTAYKCITRCTVNTKECYDITSTTFVDIFHLSRVHTYKTSNLELLLCTSIVEFFTLLNFTLVNTSICKLTILTIIKFETKCNTRFVIN